MQKVNKEWSFAGSWIMLETHAAGCGCSYCIEFKGKFGLSLPPNKSRNSWRILWWRWRGKLHDLRWTLPKWVESIPEEMKHLLSDFSDRYDIPADMHRLDLIRQEDILNLVPGCLIGWYYKEDLEFWKGDGLRVPKHPYEMPYRGIGVPMSGQECPYRMDLEDTVVVHHIYPTEKCSPDTQWVTLHRLLDAPDLVCVAVAKSTERPIYKTPRKS